MNGEGGPCVDSSRRVLRRAERRSAAPSGSHWQREEVSDYSPVSRRRGEADDSPHICKMIPAATDRAQRTRRAEERRCSLSLPVPLDVMRSCCLALLVSCSLGHGRIHHWGKWERGVPTRILTHEIYWGISPVKIRFRPDIDLFKFNVSLFCTQNLATPEK